MSDMSVEFAAVLAVGITALLMCFQLLLAAGLPLGKAAWKGRYRVLPMKLRYASLAAVGLLGLSCWIVLARADLMSPGAAPLGVRAGVWIFAGYLSINTVGNAASSSMLERYVMTPVSALLAGCFLVVALSEEEVSEAPDPALNSRCAQRPPQRLPEKAINTPWGRSIHSLILGPRSSRLILSRLTSLVSYWLAVSEPNVEKARKTGPFRDVVRKGGLEPPRPCGRQPLKLVDLLR